MSVFTNKMLNINRKIVDLTLDSDSDNEPLSQTNLLGKQPSLKRKRDEKCDMLLKLQETEKEILSNIGSDENYCKEIQTEKDLSDILGIHFADKRYDLHHQEVSTRWGNYVINGIGRQQAKELLAKYPIPSNCKALQAPKLNEQIEKCLSKSTKIQDNYISQLQIQLASVLSIIDKIMSKSIIETNTSESSLTLSTLQDSGEILCEVFYQLSHHRKFLIQPFLNEIKRKLGGQYPSDIFKNSMDRAEEDFNMVSQKKIKMQQECISENEPQQGPSGIQVTNSRELDYSENNIMRKTMKRDFFSLSRSIYRPNRASFGGRGSYIGRRRFQEINRYYGRGRFEEQ